MTSRLTPRLRSVTLTVIAVTALLAACDDKTPTTPSLPPPSAPTTSIPPVAVFSVSTMVLNQCTPPATSLATVPRVFSPVAFTDEAGGWLGRSSPNASGDAEVHLSRTGDTALTGTLKGRLMHMFSFGPAAQVLISGSGPGNSATLRGVFVQQGAAGQIEGTIVYTDFLGNVTTCRGGEWVILPQPVI